MKYPNWSNYGTPVTGPTYAYAFDAVGRPGGLTENVTQPMVQNVVYNAASQITSMQYLQYTGGPAWLTETRAYNARLQMTSQTVAPAGGGAALLDLRYNYSATANNGQISSLQDLVSGETVSYQYDELQRLISATAGTAWGNAYSFDGFGNLLAKTVTAGSAPSLSINVDGNTNRITTAGYTYDLNGNLTAVPGVTGMAYDVDNRLVTANGEAYAYTPGNQRVWLRKSGGAVEQFTFYGVDGARLAVYQKADYNAPLTGSYFTVVKQEVYFAGKRIRSGGFAVAEDRLGSTRREDTTASRFFPYGEENGSTANDRQKFATYYRDAGTGLDYANQRYYSATVGRFLTADPYMASGGPADPGSWNRYGYVGGDPVNWIDPSGYAKCRGSYVVRQNGKEVVRQTYEYDCFEPNFPGHQELPSTILLQREMDDMRGRPNRSALRQSLIDVMRLAHIALDNPGCDALFRTSQFDPKDVLQRIFKGELGQIAFTNLGQYTGETDFSWTDLRVSLDPLGVYASKVKISFDLEYWNMGFLQENLTAVLHELGHAINFLGTERNKIIQRDDDPAINRANTNLVRDTCIRGIKP